MSFEQRENKPSKIETAMQQIQLLDLNDLITIQGQLNLLIEEKRKLTKQEGKEQIIFNNVTPTTDIVGNLNHFGYVDSNLKETWVTNQLESSSVPKTIELIKCNQGTTEQIRKEIDDRGYISVPSSYLIGLGVQYSEAVKEHLEPLHTLWRIISLDEKSELVIGSPGQPASSRTDLIILKAEKWQEGRGDEKGNALSTRGTNFTTEDISWWYAVAPK